MSEDLLVGLRCLVSSVAYADVCACSTVCVETMADSRNKVCSLRLPLFLFVSVSAGQQSEEHTRLMTSIRFSKLEILSDFPVNKIPWTTRNFYERNINN